MRQLIDLNWKDFSGFKLCYVPKKGLWQIHAGKHGIWEGSLKEVWQKMYWDFEIENREIKMALNEMDKNRHFVSSFGIFGTFICTFEK